MTSATFVLSPISAEEADHLRDRGGPVYVADEHPGFPCRQCLQDAAIGDELVLVSHDPFESESEYRSASPIFLHRTRCGSPGSITELPTQLTARQLSVRAFRFSGDDDRRSCHRRRSTCSDDRSILRQRRREPTSRPQRHPGLLGGLGRTTGRVTDRWQNLDVTESHDGSHLLAVGALIERQVGYSRAITDGRWCSWPARPASTTPR